MHVAHCVVCGAVICGVLCTLRCTMFVRHAVQCTLYTCTLYTCYTRLGSWSRAQQSSHGVTCHRCSRACAAVHPLAVVRLASALAAGVDVPSCTSCLSAAVRSSPTGWRRITSSAAALRSACLPHREGVRAQ